MKLSQRDKVIVLLLPALVVFSIYGWWVYPGKQAALKKAVAALHDAESKAPALQNTVVATQSKLAKLNGELKKLESNKQLARQAWDRAAGRCTDPRLRNERINKLDSLLSHRGLRVVEDGEAESGKDGKLSPAVEGLCKELSGMSAQLKPQLRKVRIVGRYLDVLAALDDLATKEVIAIPVGLVMKEAHPNYSVREWVLLVWI